ncbi:MAG: iron-containing alcohol dehydrogenase [Desulfobacterales bacterium]|jgi:alcohol dehydrogenase class IV|nr:iron-containing alcohol dehydrogenase [Desulfobacterales bacterium]
MEFEFATAGRIVFGCGVARRIGGEVAALGRRALVVTGAGAERSAELRRRLDDHHVMHTVFQVGGEPTTERVAAGIDRAREFGCNVVVGIGGGSVIDAGKAIAAMIANGSDLMEHLEVIGKARPLALPSAPYVAVPTTAGTGAEVTRNAVLGSAAHRIKVSLRSPFMLPRLALVDPELTYSMPPALTAATGFDALTQLLEAFVSRDATPLTDGICREGLRRAGRALAAAVADGTDRQAREEMCIASLCGGLALANARLGAVHGIAGPFGGMFPAPHGAVCGRLLPVVAAANIAALRERLPGSPALARYQEAARILTANTRAEPEEGAQWLQALCTRLAIPPLSAYGFSPQRISEVVANSLLSSSMRGNPVELTAAELTLILDQSH